MKNETQKTAIIIGAGPAGLTAAYELITKTDIKPIILEAGPKVGGLSRTIERDGWHFDIGPHRFFSKSRHVNQLWEEVLPLQGKPSQEDMDLDRKIKISEKAGAPDPEQEDRVMLSKNRLTRIYHRQKMFDYPIKLNFSNLRKIGLLRVLKILMDYLAVRIKPVKPEVSLEDFFINRFGRSLYATFFKDYTEKVWGVSCREIPKSWGAQRIKKLSVAKIALEAIKKIIHPDRETKETSLIDNFLYPKLGAGQMYEEMAKIITKQGGLIITGAKVKSIKIENNKIISLKIESSAIDGGSQETEFKGDYFFSSLALKDLIEMMDNVPEKIREIGLGLRYRDLILVGLVYKKLKLKNNTNIKTKNDLVPDNWIYVQEKGAKMGRLDIFNNFSPWLLKDKNQVLIGTEYFCTAGDELWNLSDEEMVNFSAQELSKMAIADHDNLVTGYVHRQTKAYPAYLGSYDKFPDLKNYLNSLENFYSIGRNGQHRYNNMDHSMLTAIKAVASLISGEKDKTAVWEVNAEEEYHEKK